MSGCQWSILVMTLLGVVLLLMGKYRFSVNDKDINKESVVNQTPQIENKNVFNMLDVNDVIKNISDYDAKIRKAESDLVLLKHSKDRYITGLLDHVSIPNNCRITDGIRVLAVKNINRIYEDAGIFIELNIHPMDQFGIFNTDITRPAVIPWEHQSKWKVITISEK